MGHRGAESAENNKSWQMLIGVYDLGGGRVSLYADPTGSGGSFDMDLGQIIVGLNHGSWPRVVAVLLHEAMECAMTQMGLRYQPNPDYANDSAAWMFVMDHTQFGEASARAAWFMAKSLPELAKVYRRRS